MNYIPDTTEKATTHKDSLWTFDPSELDSPAEIIADRFGIPIDVARAISQWHDDEVAKVAATVDTRTGGMFLHRVLAWLMGPGDAKAKTVALCFAADLQSLIGWSTLAEAAEDLGMTSANLSKLQTEIQAWLSLPETQWNKTKYRFQQCKTPHLKEVPTVERVAQGFRRWAQKVDRDALTSEQRAVIRKSLAEITDYVQGL